MSVAIIAPLSQTFLASQALSFLPEEMGAISRFAHQELSLAGLNSEREAAVETLVASRVGSVSSHPEGLLPFLRKVASEKFPHETTARYTYFLAGAIKAFAESAENYSDLSVNASLYRHAQWALDRHVGRDLRDRVHPSDEWINLGANHHPNLDQVLVLKAKGAEAEVEVPVKIFETGARIVFPDYFWSKVLREWRGPLSPIYLNPAGSSAPQKPIRGPLFSPRLDVSVFPRVSFCADAGESIPATAAFTQARLTAKRPKSDFISLEMELELPPTVSPYADEVIRLIANQRTAAFLYGVLLFLRAGSGNVYEDTHLLMNEEMAPAREIDWVET